MSETERNQIKGALLKCAEENENRPTFTGYVVVSRVCRSAVERIEELEEMLEKIKKGKLKWVDCQKKNEWHYVKNGDLPKKSISVLAYFKGEDVSLVECLYIPNEGFKHPVFSEWYEPTAWIEKEKTLTKELEQC